MVFFVAKQITEVIKNGNYDLIIAGKESLDYNGGMVPGMIAGFTDYNFINACTSLELDGNNAITVREIDGGNETIATSLPLIIGGQKGLVEESELKIPNMRGIMMARKKPLQVVEPVDSSDKTSILSFEKPAEKSAVKLIDADNIDELISLLHNEAKVI
jgi:electron transfer flavoprotein beta subunit